MQKIYPLQGRVQHYSWGGIHYIPSLLNITNKELQPFAEYWLGAHPNHPSIVTQEKGQMELDDLIAKNPCQILGKPVADTFGRLPFLLKILDVRHMLSIQVHPSKEEAERRYHIENEGEIPLTAPHRNYRDDNHKPEMMVALDTFWLLHGFQEEGKLVNTLAAVPQFASLSVKLREEGPMGLFHHIMTMPQEAVNAVLQPLSESIIPLYQKGTLQKTQHHFWAARAMQTYYRDGQFDRGILSIYLLNLVRLEKGQGIYQPSGMLHAYLEGQNVELMANSDNVLRAGLTDKHIDVNELLDHVDFSPVQPQILSPDERCAFVTPAAEFGLYQFSSDTSLDIPLHAASAEILLVLEGNVQVSTEGRKLKTGRGESVFISAGTDYHLSSVDAVTVFRATVGNL